MDTTRPAPEGVRPAAPSPLPRFEDLEVVRDDGGRIVSGSADALFHLLLTSSNHPTYAFTLLLNIRTTMSPLEALTALIHQTMYAQNAAGENFRKESRLRMFERVFRVCSIWVKSIPYDFRQEEMLNRLHQLLQLCAVNTEHEKEIDQLVAIVHAALNKLSRYEKALKSLSVEEGEWGDGLSGILCSSLPIDIAQQLTHIELERFSMVGPDEIVMAISCCDISSVGLDSSSVSLSAYIDWSNRLSSLVASEVLRNNRKRNRVRIIEGWVDTAKACVDIGNFNSTIAIVAGLTAPAVTRLKKTWARVDRAKLEILQHQLDPSGNFGSYRATMKAAVWRAKGAISDTEKIIIPFFVLLLKDLYLTFHSLPRTFPNGHINFESYDRLSEQMLNVVRWRERTCSYPRNAVILQYLLCISVFDEDTQMKRSFDCEEPESHEKELYRRLKLKAPAAIVAPPQGK